MNFSDFTSSASVIYGEAVWDDELVYAIKDETMVHWDHPHEQHDHGSTGSFHQQQLETEPFEWGKERGEVIRMSVKKGFRV